MLTHLKVRNFRAIRELSLPFCFAEGKAPNHWQDLEYLPFVQFKAKKRAFKRIVPTFVLYGANASGKSTVLEAMAALQRFVLQGKLFFNPYKLDKSQNEGTEIELSFIVEDDEYKYNVVCLEKSILTEELFVNDISLFRSQQGELIFGQGKIEGMKEKFELVCIDALTKQQTYPLIGFLVNEYRGLDARINKAFAFFKDKLSVLMDNTTPPGLGLNILKETFQDIPEEEREGAALELLSRSMRKLDFRIRRIAVERRETNLSELPDVVLQMLTKRIGHSPEKVMSEKFKTYHKSSSGNEVEFDFNEESSGTKCVFGILAVLLAAIRTGGVVLCDELDNSLHTMIVQELVRLFKAKDRNTKGAQLIFTTHDTALLSSSLMTVSDVGFVYQNGFKGVSVKRLSSITGGRNDENFEKRYLEGFYIELPSPYL